MFIAVASHDQVVYMHTLSDPGRRDWAEAIAPSH